MPRSALSRPRTKRKREPSPEDDKGRITVTTNTFDTPNAPSQNKRPRRMAASKAEAKMKVKEEEDDTILPKSAAPAVKPEPELKLESEVKVEVKPEANREAGPLKAPTKRGRRMTTKQPPLVGPSLAPAPRDGQEAADERGGAPTPSESSSKITKKKGRKKGPSRAVKKAREEKWKKWCEARKWIHQHDPGYKQNVGDVVAHRSDARAYYRFKDYEIDTIPYVPFENKYNPKSFGGAYNNANLRTLISRKLAYLAGLDEQFDPKTKEDEFLKEGWKLFEHERA